MKKKRVRMRRVGEVIEPRRVTADDIAETLAGEPRTLAELSELLGEPGVKLSALMRRDSRFTYDRGRWFIADTSKRIRKVVKS